MNNDDINSYESMTTHINILFDLIKNGKTNKFIKYLSALDITEININTKDNNDNYLIFFALLLNNSLAIKKIIDYGARIDILDTNGYNILYYPIKFNYTQIIDILIEYDKQLTGISLVNIQDKLHNTPLHYAVIYNNIDVIKKLLDNNADVDYKNSLGYNVLHLSIIKKNINMFSIIIKYITKINITTNDGDTSLHLACNYQLIECINTLLTYNSNLYAINNVGFQPIFYSIIQNDILIVKLLSKHGLNLYHQDTIYGNTILHYATIYDHIEIIDYILSISTITNKHKNIDIAYTENINKSNYVHMNEINPNIINIDGLSILHIMLYKYHNKYDKYINLLLPLANLNYQDNDGYTILHIMAEKNIWAKFESILYTKKNNIFIINKNNKTVLDMIPLIDREHFYKVITHSYSNNLTKYINSLEDKWQITCAKKIAYKNPDCIAKIRNEIINNKKSIPDKINKLRINVDINSDVHISTFTGKQLDIIVGIKYLTNKYNNTTSIYCKQLNEDIQHEDPKFHIFNLEIKWIYQKIYVPVYFEKCILKILNAKKYRWIIIPIGIILSNGHHMNSLLYDTKKHIMERFEPHGSGYPYEFNYNPDLLDDILLRNMSNIVYNFDKSIKITYITPKSYLPKIGFQSFDVWEANINTNIGDPSGFCALWCFWYLDYRLKYPDHDPKNIVKKIITNIRLNNYSFRNIIRNYSKKITDLRDALLHKIGKNINDYINRRLSNNELETLRNSILEQKI